MKKPKCESCGDAMSIIAYTRQGMAIFICQHATLSRLNVTEAAMYCMRTQQQTKVSLTYGKARYPKALTSAANVRALRSAFADLTKNTDLTYEKLSKSVLQTANEESLLEFANIGIMLGLPTKELPNLFGAAMKLGFATGIDTKHAIQALSIGVGRQSRMVLDNIGIMFKAQDAYAKYPNTNKVDAWKRYALQLITEKAKLLPQPDKKKVAKLQHDANIYNQHTKLGESLLSVSTT